MVMWCSSSQGTAIGIMDVVEDWMLIYLHKEQMKGP